MASCVKKEGDLYYGEDPMMGQTRGMDPWAVEHSIHLISMDETCAQGIMSINDQNTQQYGTVHGGMLTAFADTIAGHSLVPHGKMCVTQSSTVNFLRPAKGTYLLCRAVPLKVGKTTCVVSVEQLSDEDELVLSALFTFAVAREITPVTLPPEYPILRR